MVAIIDRYGYDATIVLHNGETLPGDPLENLFIVKDGKAEITPYLSYVITNFAKDFFKRKIALTDVSGVFYRKTVVKGVEKEAVDAELSRFATELEELEARKLQWRVDNPDYYRQQVCLPSSEGLRIYIPNVEDLHFDLDDCIQGYKNANSMCASFGSSLDRYCTEKRPMLNLEHKPEYDAFVESQREALGIPTRTELEAELPKTDVVKARLCLDRTKATNIKSASVFTQAFLAKMIIEG